MSIRRIIARNAVWSGAAMASGMITGFITAPFLVHRLGQTTYGLWIVIVSLTSYFNLIDLGLRSSITRHVAFFRAKGNQSAVNEILSTAGAILVGAAGVTVVATLILLFFFSRYGDVPPDQLSSARLALLLAGLTVAVTLAMSIFDAALWGYERLDLLNGIDIGTDITQTTVLLLLVWRGGSLVTVASVVLVGTLCSELAKAAACYFMDRTLHIRLSNVNKWAARELFGFGLWKFLWSIGNRATAQSGPLIIWARLSANVATPYSVASRLVTYARGISTVGTGIVTPTATALHARNQHDTQQALFIEGGKYCLAMALFFAACIVFLGKSFITFWMGASLASASAAAAILAVGEILPMSQWVTYSVLLGRERHRVVAVASFVETFIVVGAGLLVARTYGLTGVCVAIAIPGALLRGVLPIVYGCRLLEISQWKYLRQVMIAPMIAISIPAAALAALVNQRPPENWLELFAYGGAFSITYFIACCLIVVGPEQIRSILTAAKASIAQMFVSESEVTP